MTIQEILRDPIWQTVGVVAVIILGIANIYLMTVRRRKALSYVVESHEPVLSVGDEVGDRLKITYEDVAVTNLYLVKVTIINTGWVPIVTEDIQNPITISLGDEARILSAMLREANSNRLVGEWAGGTNSNEISLPAMLMNRKDAFTFTLIVSDADKITVHGRILGVSKIEPVKTRKRLIRIFFLLTCLFGGMSLGVIRDKIWGADSIGPIVILLGFLVWLLVLLILGDLSYKRWG